MTSTADYEAWQEREDQWYDDAQRELREQRFGEMNDGSGTSETTSNGGGPAGVRRSQ